LLRIANLHLVLEVDALDSGQEAVHEMLARSLAVADDVDPGVFLHLQPEQGGVGLGALELGAARLPFRPELLGLGEPRRLGQAAGDRGFEHELIPCWWRETARRRLPSRRAVRRTSDTVPG
jgi:hypothetical protein